MKHYLAITFPLTVHYKTTNWALGYSDTKGNCAGEAGVGKSQNYVLGLFSEVNTVMLQPWQPLGSPL